MNSNIPPVIPAARPRSRKGYLVAAVAVIALLLLALSARAVAGYFFLGNEAASLRKVVVAQAGGHCHKKFAVRLGWITTGLIRYGTHFANLPPEPRAAIDTLRRVEVGVYKLDDLDDQFAPGNILAQTDLAMKKRNWERIVGVIHERQLVGIYAPVKGVGRANIECAVLVLNGRDLVIAAGSANPLPLLELASKHFEAHLEKRRPSS